MKKIKNYTSKQRFYMNNQDVFAKYFNDSLYYFALVASCRFDKIDEIIKKGKNNS